MKKAIEDAFPQVLTGGCLETFNEPVFHIFDNVVEPKRCFVKVKDSDPIHFTVNNSSGKHVSFLAIDKCIFDDQQAARCDCAVFDDAKFSFIEISDSKKLHRNQKRKKALEQLGITIDVFRSSGILFPGELNAIICFVGKNIHPARSSQNNEARLAFNDERNAFLLEGNEFEF